MEFLDLAFIMDRIVPQLNRGLSMSMALIVPSVLIGTTLGIFTGVTRVFGRPWMRRIADGAVAVIRGVPLTVQLMILYFGLPYLKVPLPGTLAEWYGKPTFAVFLEPYTAALVGFIFCTAAYQSEYVRGALLSIRQGQIKAAQALGMTKLQIIWSVVVPQAVRRALPGCGNEIIYLIKYSSLAYVVTFVELTGEAKVLVSRTFRPTEVYVAAACYYLALVTLATWALHALERKLSISGFDKPSA